MVVCPEEFKRWPSPKAIFINVLRNVHSTGKAQKRKLPRTNKTCTSQKCFSFHDLISGKRKFLQAETESASSQFRQKFAPFGGTGSRPSRRTSANLHKIRFLYSGKTLNNCILFADSELKIEILLKKLLTINWDVARSNHWGKNANGQHIELFSRTNFEINVYGSLQ